jgi:hypothetical protein
VLRCHPGSGGGGVNKAFLYPKRNINASKKARNLVLTYIHSATFVELLCVLTILDLRDKTVKKKKDQTHCPVQVRERKKKKQTKTGKLSDVEINRSGLWWSLKMAPTT